MNEPDGESVLEDLPYNELRDRAFALAEANHDHAFFRDLRRHLPAAAAIATEGGSLGDIGATLSEMVRSTRELSSQDAVGDLEPLFVARFATYLRENAPS